MNESDLCPTTHLPCGDGYCLPIYFRCNGVNDCPDGRDEENCGSYRCKGYFRCRASRVCLHPDHVCDGIVQCPQQDDELLCDLKCPLGCYCQGLAFVCNQSFHAASVPHLRYLDATGSMMTLADVKSNCYLIYLSLSGCNLNSTDISSLCLRNLQILDLSVNFLKEVGWKTFSEFDSLKVLNLSRNPLENIMANSKQHGRPTLEVLNLSFTLLRSLNSTIFSKFINLKELNLSHTQISSLTKENFITMNDIQILDLTVPSLKIYPTDMLKNLNHLRLVHADDFKICCTLPDNFNLHSCISPFEEIESCEDLLHSIMHRLFLWLVVILALFGNSGSLMARIYLKNESLTNSFNILVSNLNVADFLMGVYLLIIGVADQVFKGEYHLHIDRWRDSVPCHVAGFLSLLSSEMSAFLICLITLDRFLALRFPFSRLRFGTKSTMVACGIAWSFGFIIAVVPLLPITSHWNFYSQTGICIPLPFTNEDTFKGYYYSFSVLILLNLVLFLLIAVGQMFIYITMSKKSVAHHRKRTSRDATIARRLVSIVVSDFLCWFPVGLLGLMAVAGIKISSKINVAVVIFVLPFNSALNPFLYTFNVIMEKHHKSLEERIEKRLQLQYSANLTRLPSETTVTREVAFNQIKDWLKLGLLNLKDLDSTEMTVTREAALNRIKDWLKLGLLNLNDLDSTEMTVTREVALNRIKDWLKFGVLNLNDLDIRFFPTVLSEMVTVEVND